LKSAALAWSARFPGADVLFFLHTFNSTAPWQPAKPGDPPPAAFKYVVMMSA
jgi:hypothetical protein